MRVYTDYDAFKVVWDTCMENVPDRVRVLQNHAPAQLFDGLFPGAQRITWLRNPVKRVVSAYLYDLKAKMIPKDEKIYDFIARPEQRNVMTFFTAGGDLSRFAFVGLTERFDDDLQRLADVLEWPPGYPIEHLNTTSRRSVAKRLLSTKKVVTSIQAMNQDDMDLYAWALWAKAVGILA